MGATESVFSDEAPTASLHNPEQQDDASPRHPLPRTATANPPRRRPPPSKPIQRLHGLILGGPKTGKHTLLQRLEGKDPYAEDADLEPPSSVTIPYKSPPKETTWDRILLQVGLPTGTTNQKADFVVVLISPKHDLENTKAYLISVLMEFLRQLGYIHHQEEGTNQGSSQQQEQPVCVSILFNFCDIQQQNSFRPELEQVVQEVLDAVPPERLVLEFGATSLRNCYGLNILHHFIYRSYLQRKRADLEQQLTLVQTQAQATRSPPVVAYSDFLKLLGATTAAQVNNGEDEEEDSPPISPQHDRRKNPTLTATQQSPPSSSDDEQESPIQNNRHSTLANHQARGVSRRSYLPQPRPPVRIGKDALEAFLASDNDEEEQQQVKSKKQKKKQNKLQNTTSSDEEEEDDFFYDESGTRRSHHAQSLPTQQPQQVDDDERESDSDIDDDVKPAASRKPQSKPVTPTQPAPNVQNSSSVPSKNGYAQAAVSKERDESKTWIPQRQEPESLKGLEQSKAEKVPPSTSRSMSQSISDEKQPKSAVPEPTTKSKPEDDTSKDDLVHESDKRLASPSSTSDKKEEEDGDKPSTRSKAAKTGSLESSSASSVVEETAEKEANTEPVSKDGEADSVKTDESEPTPDDAEEEVEASARETTRPPAPQSTPGKEDSDAEEHVVQRTKHEYADDDNEHASNPAPAPVSDDSDDGEFFVEQQQDHDEDEEDTRSFAPPTTSAAPAQDDSDDEEFFVDQQVDDQVVNGDEKPYPPASSPKVPEAKHKDSDEDDSSVQNQSEDPSSNARTIPPKKASSISPLAPSKTPPVPSTEEDSDDDEFFIQEEAPTPAPDRPIAPLPPVRSPPKADPPTNSHHHKPTFSQAGRGLSVAALAAIAAAQQEAEAMLLQQSSDVSGDKPKKGKEKKKKKDKERDGENKKKKEKKKKKTKSEESN